MKAGENMNLYVCEKASVAKALSNVLPGVKMKDQNFIRCGEDIVAWASGHLLELCEPEDYDPRYRQWGADTLLYVPEKWRYKEKPRTKALLAGLKKLIKGLKDTDVIVNTGDADREGTTLIDEILDYCGWRGKTLRLRINDVNPEAIRKALGNIKDNGEYRGEYLAGQARMRADWLVGLPLSRFVTVSLRDAGYEAGVMSVGRVQTPTLGLVVERDRQIREFIPSPYFDLRASVILGGGGKITGRWMPSDSNSPRLDGEKRIIDREWAANLARKLENAEGVISSVEKKSRKIQSPLPYSLSKLQMAASRKYDITDALVHVQKLYEMGYVTYPRSGCEYIPEEHFPEAGRVIDAIRTGCPNLAGMMNGVDPKQKSKAWDSSRITEHHAIIPTVRVPLNGALSETERKIYELICTRYALQFLPNYEYEETIVDFTANGEVFRATGRTVAHLGWQGWEKQNIEADDDTDGAEILPSAHQGETGTVLPSVEEKLTRPPAPFTYHGLIGAMNSIHTFVKDPAIRAKLKEVQGIGTEATQEGIIAVLFKRGYLEKKKKQVFSTDLGRLLIDLLATGKASVMVRPDMTALWEGTMSDIERGGAALDGFLSEVGEMVRGIISGPLVIPTGISNLPGVSRQPKCLTDGCAGFLRRIEKQGGSPFFSCPICHTTFNDVDGSPTPKKKSSGEIVEAPCPLGCGRQARRFEGRYGRYWRCSCSPNETLRDIDGAPAPPVQRVKAPCPVAGCKGSATRFTRKDGGYLWKCAQCGNFFDDLDGVPIIREKFAKGEDTKKRSDFHDHKYNQR
jgi:DNA topoisomerase-3